MTNLATALAISSVHLPPVVTSPDDFIILIIYTPILVRVNSIESVDGRSKILVRVFLETKNERHTGQLHRPCHIFHGP